MVDLKNNKITRDICPDKISFLSNMHYTEQATTKLQNYYYIKPIMSNKERNHEVSKGYKLFLHKYLYLG